MSDAIDWKARAEAAEKRCEAMREALEHCLEVSSKPERYGRFLSEIDRDLIRRALSGAWLTQYVSKEDVRGIAKALWNHHCHSNAGAVVFFEQDGKPIEIATDLSEAYQESALCEDTTNAIRTARTLGLLDGGAK